MLRTFLIPILYIASQNGNYAQKGTLSIILGKIRLES